jgi:hypothetical protein
MGCGMAPMYNTAQLVGVVRWAVNITYAIHFIQSTNQLYTFSLPQLAL